MPIMMRTVENAMPAITTEIDFTTAHVLQFMLQTDRISPSSPLYNAATTYLQHAKKDYVKEVLTPRFTAVPGLDLGRPVIEGVLPPVQSLPEVQDNPAAAAYLDHVQTMKDSLYLIQSAQDGQLYTEAENAVLMCQRVDLWCAGETEVEAALQHLLRLGKLCNDDRTVEIPTYITDYHPGAPTANYIQE
jgi:hypothetical protein